MKQKYMIVIAFIVVVTAAVISLQNPEYKSIKKKIKKADKHIKEVNDKLVSARVLTQDKEEVSKVLSNSVSEKFFVSSEEKNTFIKQLADKADLYKIPVTKIVPKYLEKTTKHILSQKYTIGIRCTYVQLGQFLSALESLDYLLQIDEIDVTPLPLVKKVGDEVQETRYQVSMQVNTVKLIKES